jgi:hypothetical protein
VADRKSITDKLDAARLAALERALKDPGVAKQERALRQQCKVIDCVFRLHEFGDESGGRKLTRELFKEVGAELHMSPSTAEKLYYAMKKPDRDTAFAMLKDFYTLRREAIAAFLLEGKSR